MPLLSALYSYLQPPPFHFSLYLTCSRTGDVAGWPSGPHAKAELATSAINTDRTMIAINRMGFLLSPNDEREYRRAVPRRRRSVIVVNEYCALAQPIRKLPGKRSGSTTALWNVNPP